MWEQAVRTDLPADTFQWPHPLGLGPVREPQQHAIDHPKGQEQIAQMAAVKYGCQ